MNYLSVVLIILVLLSAYALVTVRHENRLAFVGLQELEEQRTHSQYEWGRLMLEKATWSTQHNLYDDAKKRLGMITPPPESIVTVHRGAKAMKMSPMDQSIDTHSATMAKDALPISNDGGC